MGPYDLPIASGQHTRLSALVLSVYVHGIEREDAMNRIAIVVLISILTLSSNPAYAGHSKQCEADDTIGKYGSLNPGYQGGSALARLLAKLIHGCFEKN